MLKGKEGVKDPTDRNPLTEITARRRLIPCRRRRNKCGVCWIFERVASQVLHLSWLVVFMFGGEGVRVTYINFWILPLSGCVCFLPARRFGL